MHVPIFIKTAIAKVLCARMVGKVVCRLYKNKIPWRGFTIDVSTDQVQPEDKASLYFGLYESAEFRFCNKYVQDNWNVLEIGAGIGAITCLLRKLIGCHGWLRAVEANPGCVEVVRRNLTLNHGTNDRTDIVWAALDYSSPDSLTVPLALGDSHTTSKVEHGKDSILVPRSTLSELLTASPTNGTLCLVADIEGAEAGFILRDPRGLSRFRWLIIEFHQTEFLNRPMSPDDLISLCEEIGFRIIDRYGNVVVLMKASTSSVNDRK